MTTATLAAPNAFEVEQPRGLRDQAYPDNHGRQHDGDRQHPSQHHAAEIGAGQSSKWTGWQVGEQYTDA